MISERRCNSSCFACILISSSSARLAQLKPALVASGMDLLLVVLVVVVVAALPLELSMTAA